MKFLLISTFIFNCAIIYAQTDQSLIYGSYLGGSGDESAARAIDSKNNRFAVFGTSSSNNLPTSDDSFQPTNSGSIDAYFSIFDEEGQFLYGTYIGGSENEISGGSINFNVTNGIIIGGNTVSEDFPTESTSFIPDYQGEEDGYLASFDDEGNLEWSTYFGGANFDRLFDVASDSLGFVYAAGYTFSDDLATEGVHKTERQGTDGFLAKFTADGDLVWCTYFGGPGDDRFYSVAISPDGTAAYCVGPTNSESNVAFNGWQNEYGLGSDGLIAKFNTLDGTLDWASYYGGSTPEIIWDVLVLESSDIVIAGETTSTTNIASSGGHQEILGGFGDHFLASFSSDGQRNWGTYFGGEGSEGFGVTITEQNGMIIMTGNTKSENQIAFGNSLEPTYEDLSLFTDAAYLCKFNSSGTIQWSTYFLGGLPGSLGRVSSLGSGKLVTFGTLIDFDFSEFISENAFQSEYAGGDSDYCMFIFEDNTLSLQDYERVNLRIFPNPTTDRVYFSSEDFHLDYAYLSLYDAGGRMIINRKYTSLDEYLDVSEIPNGIYFLKGEFKQKVFQSKIIIQ